MDSRLEDCATSILPEGNDLEFTRRTVTPTYSTGRKRRGHRAVCVYRDERCHGIAIGSGPSKALAKELIAAPADVLIKVTLEASRLKLHFVSGSAFVAGKKIGTLANIVYTLVAKSQLVG